MKIIFSFLCLLCLWSCSSNVPMPTPEAEHKTTVWLLSEFGESESEVAAEIKEKLLARLVAGTKVVYPNFNKPVRLFFLRTSSPSAFSQCNGSIFVTEGMITSVPSIAELSAIIAHELAHIAREDACHVQPDSEGNISYSHEIEVEADKFASKVLLASFIDPRYLLSSIQSQYRFFKGTDAEKVSVSKRIEILQQVLHKIPAVKTKFSEERLFNKLREVPRR
jgi:hypothetical protein